MSNLTIAVDDDVLRRARVKAAQEGTSVNAVLREALEGYAGADERDRALREFVEWARTHQAPAAGTWKWNRDDLYEERLGRYGREPDVPRH